MADNCDNYLKNDSKCFKNILKCFGAFLLAIALIGYMTA